MCLVSFLVASSSFLGRYEKFDKFPPDSLQIPEMNLAGKPNRSGWLCGESSSSGGFDLHCNAWNVQETGKKKKENWANTWRPSVTAPFSKHFTQEPFGELSAALCQEWPLNGQGKAAKARLQVGTWLLGMHSVCMLPSTLLCKLLYEVMTLAPQNCISDQFSLLWKQKEHSPRHVDISAALEAKSTAEHFCVLAHRRRLEILCSALRKCITSGSCSPALQELCAGQPDRWKNGQKWWKIFIHIKVPINYWVPNSLIEE